MFRPQRSYTGRYHDDDDGPIHGSFSREQFTPFGGESRKKKRFPTKFVVIGLMAFVVAVSSTILIASGTSASPVSAVKANDLAAKPTVDTVNDGKTAPTSLKSASITNLSSEKQKLLNLQAQAKTKVYKATQDIARWMKAEELKEKNELSEFHKWVQNTVSKDQRSPVSESDLYEMWHARQVDRVETREAVAKDKVDDMIDDVKNWLDQVKNKMDEARDETENQIEKSYDDADTKAHKEAEKAAKEYNKGMDWLDDQYSKIDKDLSAKAEASKERIDKWYSKSQAKVDQMSNSLDNFMDGVEKSEENVTDEVNDLSESAKKTLGDALKKAAKWLEDDSGKDSRKSSEVNLGQGPNGDVPPDADAPPEPSPDQSETPSGPPPDGDAPPIGGEIDPSKGSPPKDKKDTQDMFVGRSS